MKEPRRRRFPWLVLALLAASAIVFWGLPKYLPDRPLRVEFVPENVEPKLTSVRTPEQAGGENSKSQTGP